MADRGGSVRIRIGGNTQETASLVDSLPNNTMIGKDKSVIGGSSRTVRIRDCSLAVEVLTPLAGSDTDTRVYGRTTVLALECLFPGQREVVSRYSLQ